MGNNNATANACGNAYSDSTASTRQRNLPKKAATAVIGTFIALVLSISPIAITGATETTSGIDTAYATELSDAQKELREVQATVDAALDEYHAAQDEIDAYQAEIDSLQAQIDEIEAKLAPHREQLASIAKWQYLNGPQDLINMLFNSDLSFEEIVEQMGQLEKISDDKVEAMQMISEGEEEIEAALAEQKTLQAQEQEKADEAKAIAEENQATADELTEKIEGLREEQREYLLGKGLSGGGPALDIPEEGDVVDYALSRVGCPYVWGASGPTSFDCSGLVMWAYQHAYGISLPHNSEAMYAAAKQIVPLSEARPGDVLYRSGHVGICTKAGAAEYVHAPNSGAYVRINDNNSWSRFTCALRFI